MKFDAQTVIVVIIVLMVGVAVGYFIGCKLCNKCPVPKDTEVIQDGNLKSIKVAGTLQTGDGVEGGADVEAISEGGNLGYLQSEGLEVVSVTVRDPNNKLESMLEMDSVYFGGAPVGGLTPQQKEMLKKTIKFLVDTVFSLFYDQESLQLFAKALLDAKNGMSRAEKFDKIIRARMGFLKLIAMAFLNNTNVTDLTLEIVSIVKSRMLKGPAGFKTLVSSITAMVKKFQSLTSTKQKITAAATLSFAFTGLVSTLISSFSDSTKELAIWFRETTEEEVYALETFIQFVEGALVGVTNLGISAANAALRGRKVIDQVGTRLSDCDWGVFTRELIPQLLDNAATATDVNTYITAALTGDTSVIVALGKGGQYVVIIRRFLNRDSEGANNDIVEQGSTAPPISNYGDTIDIGPVNDIVEQGNTVSPISTYGDTIDVGPVNVANDITAKNSMNNNALYNDIATKYVPSTPLPTPINSNGI